MPIPIEDRYKIIFDNYKFASEYRIRLITGWAAIYAGLAAAFAWFYQNSRAIIWIVPAIAIGITILMWIADRRHRPAIGRSKTVGANIEKDQSAQIPQDQRYFADIESGISHSWAIDVFAALSLILLGIATCILICYRGELP
ncbi:MAG: hypothetical protein HY707_12410 [Ignavibacteriae bacterium]|nr:hypothetical protein [Ignavibacteriota bacterium]